MENIALPTHYCKWEKDDWAIFYDPNNFTWIKANKDGSKIIESFRNSSSIDEAISQLAASCNICREEITQPVTSFLEKGLEVGFFHKKVYQEMTFKDSVPNYPNVLYLSVTNRCNLDCKYCYNKKDRLDDDRQAQLGDSDYLNLLRDAVEMKVEKLVFTGGEPLLHPSLLEIAQQARQMGISTELLTNGLLIDHRNSGEIVKHFDAITVSLDCHTKEIHDKQRGDGTFEKVTGALKCLREAGARWLCTAVVVTRENVTHIPDYYAFAFEKLQVNQVVNQVYLPFDYSASTGDNANHGNLLPSFEDIYLMEEQVRDYLKRRNAGHDETDQPLLRSVTCGAATGELGIAPNGDVFPCHTLHKKEFHCGNIKEQNLKKILDTSETIRFFRELTVEKIDKCSGCDVRYICAGGCRALAYCISGQIAGHNSLLCDYLHKRAIDKLWAASHYPLCDVNVNKKKESKPKS